MSSLNFFIKQLWALFRIYVFGLILLFTYRVVFLFRLSDLPSLSTLKYDLAKAFITGFRFDTMVMMYALAPSLLFCLLIFIFRSVSYQKFLHHFLPVLNTFLLSAYLLLSVIDIFYYTYFQSHLNMLVFGFFEDDTEAVMKSVWSDYPLVRAIIFIVLMIFIIYKLAKRFHQSELPSFLKLNKKNAIITVVLTFGFFFLGMRGSLGTFPLQIDDSTVSENSTINLLPVNAPFALKEAFMFRHSQSSVEGNKELVKKMGYNNPENAISDYTHADTSNGFDALFSKTPFNEYAQQHPPNVIFFLMESMSNYNLNLHSKDCNLLGTLEKHFNDDIVFRHFVSSGNGTIVSLEGTMVNTPVTSLAQSKFRYQTYHSSVAKPFAEAGYNTTFITGGKLGWRNINEFIPFQYFKNVESNQNVKAKITGATECEWGVFDEYLFDYIFLKLNENNKQPQFVYALTTTNHTPFTLPSHYKPFPVNIPVSLPKPLKVDENLAKKNLTNYQYSNDCLGRFIDKIKASPFADNTIVIATGDHNNLMLFDFKEEEWAHRIGVPLIMYIPEKYLEHARVDTSLWASHKDIFPTIYNLALSDAKYFNGGLNLFDSSLKHNDYYAVNTGDFIAINDDGAVKFDPDNRFYYWKNNSVELERIQSPNEKLNELLKKARAYYASMSFYINEETKKKNIDGKIK